MRLGPATDLATVRAGDSHGSASTPYSPKAMGFGQYVEIAVGLAVLLLTFQDLFQAVVLPRRPGAAGPAGGAARLAVLAESASGVILVALVISLLFSLYQSFQEREELVVALDALAGAPPSGIQILETAATDRMPQQLEETFNDWRRWSAAVLESHLAYPILFYFRSSHDNEAWLSSFGAVMDAATLVLSLIEHD